MRAMYDGFFSVFSLPCQLHSDQEKNFESKLFKELCELTGVAKTRTTPFHPQCDGQTERMNRTLLQMLRRTVDENPASWPQCLPTVLSAYRMMVHKITGLTPNMAMFGREVMPPASLIAKPPDEPVTSSVPFVVDLRDAIRNAHDNVRLAPKRPLGYSVSTTMRNPVELLSAKANWSGCFGHNRPFVKSSKSFAKFGRVRGR